MNEKRYERAISNRLIDSLICSDRSKEIERESIKNKGALLNRRNGKTVRSLDCIFPAKKVSVLKVFTGPPAAIFGGCPLSLKGGLSINGSRGLSLYSNSKQLRK
ncbi:hypothetical protein Salat_2482400 [Sesamum alatum]|uniref:Uncharacterized protein n=1 Tax=Sesamum alatum TaxID=300844 RepID=A0AAE2CBZ3_9LAMI|nr:hypothetical protein Salat_2482400 [Sesamum alatum]